MSINRLPIPATLGSRLASLAACMLFLLGFLAGETRAQTGTTIHPVGLNTASVAISADGRVGEIAREVVTSSGNPASFRLLFRERVGTAAPGPWEAAVSEEYYRNPEQLTVACLRYDADGLPVILHLSTDPSGASWTFRECSRIEGVWTETRSFPGSETTQAAFAVAPDGSIDALLMYTDTWSGSVSMSYLRVDDDGVGVVEAVDLAWSSPTKLRGFEAPQAGNLGWWFVDYPRHISIARDATGGIHIVYSVDQYINEIPGGTQVLSSLYYKMRSPSGEWSEPDEILSFASGWGDAGLGASIAVAPNGKIAVASAYLPRSNTGSPGVCQLRYLVKTATGWSSSIVASASAGYISSDGERGTGLEPHLVFDELSRPRILFSDHASKHWPGLGAQSYSGQVRLATRASPTTGAWTITTLVNRGGTPAHNFQNYRSSQVVRAGLAMVVTTSWKFVQGNPFVDTYVALPSGQLRAPPTIATVTPAAGPLTGGTTVTIAGTNLSGATVKVGDNNATDVVSTATSITCKTPAGTAGSKDVTVATLGGTATLAGGFTYRAPPTIQAVAPASGPAAGGTPITITGTNLTGATVKVGGVAATSVSASATSITCTTPAGNAGAKSVVVTTPGGSASKANGFTYLPTPTISTVTPSTGPVSGGTVLTIAGTNLSGATVSIGGVAATSVTASASSITCTAPANTAGAKNVVVTNQNGTATKASGFAYVGAPTISGVAPSAGPLAGGTTITISGMSLLGATVKVGGVNATNVVATLTSVTCKTPAGAAGPKDVQVTTSSGTATAPGAFTHMGAPTISAVTPTSGPAAGGTSITIVGTNLSGATVKIGGASATSVVATETSITCTTPAGSVGAKSVVVTAPGGSVTKTNGFTYLSAPTISTVAPAAGPIAGGTVLTISGTNLSGATVAIGGVAATSVTATATSITCTTPPNTAGAKNVVVTNQNGTATKASGFTYMGLPAISSVTPSAGPLAGGTTITIAGTNLFGATVLVGGAAATNVVSTVTSITCKTPPGTVGPKDVTVATLGGTATLVGGFTYRAPPTISTVTPVSGPAAGGTSITITGTNLSGATVKIGGVNATEVVSSETTIDCTTPAGAVGARSVVVTTPGGSATKANGFTYLPEPTISTVAPSTGPVAGGTVLTISGTNLSGATVAIGGVAATSVTATATSITCTTPANTAGAKNVVVTNQNGTATKASGFTYLDEPTISGVTPSAGPLAGGTTITITGMSLLGATVKVGGVNATNVVATLTSVTCKTPAGAAGPKDVQVTTSSGTATAPGAFTHMGAPTISTVTPSAGPPAGGTSITIAGTNLTGATVKIGGINAMSVAATATSITCTTPPSSLGAKSVQVTAAGGSVTKPNGFTYTNLWYTVLEQSPNPSVVTNASLRSAIIATGRPWRVRDNGTGIEMLLVPPGSFEMGCVQGSNLYGCYSWEQPVHTVTLTNAYYIGRYEVTQAEWQARMGYNPSLFQGNAQRPLERVAWFTIQNFLNATGLRLPTEAEWEYACRAGTTTPFHRGPGFPNGTTDDNLVDQIAWWNGNSGGLTHPVGGKAANALGLHDMLGNVWEWCGDWHAEYTSAPQTNPTGPATGTYRVFRGGSFGGPTFNVRSSCRAYAPDSTVNWIGFRVARNPY